MSGAIRGDYSPYALEGPSSRTSFDDRYDHVPPLASHRPHSSLQNVKDAQVQAPHAKTNIITFNFIASMPLRGLGVTFGIGLATLGKIGAFVGGLVGGAVGGLFAPFAIIFGKMDIFSSGSESAASIVVKTFKECSAYGVSIGQMGLSTAGGNLIGLSLSRGDSSKAQAKHVQLQKDIDKQIGYVAGTLSGVPSLVGGAALTVPIAALMFLGFLVALVNAIRW